MKILLVGEYYSTNLGDPLLCETVCHCIRQAFPKAEVIPFDISGKISATQYYEIPKRNFRKRMWIRIAEKHRKLLNYCSPLSRIYSQSSDRLVRVWYRIDEIISGETIDLVVFAGGELFMDYFAGPIYIVLNATRNIPVIFHACGMKAPSRDAVRLLKRVLKRDNIRSISLRDSYTQFNELFELAYKTHATYDTALLCSYFFSDKKADKQEGIGVGIIGLDRYRAAQSRLVQKLLKSKLEWKLFTNGNTKDYETARLILSENGVDEIAFEKYLLPKPNDTDDLVRTITAFEKIVAYRMHSQICAASFGIPSFGFVWDEKVAEFYDKLGLNENYTRDFDTINLEEILCQLDSTGNEIQERAVACGEISRNSLISEIKNALY